MKLLRTIRLDPSDTFVFERAAEPGEWAVPGAFAFLDADPATLEGKARTAFRSGFLGIASLGWSTLVQVVEADEETRRAVIETLAARLVEHFGAPDLKTARGAAAEEVAFAASLAEHPPDTLIAMHRVQRDGEIRETFRTLRPRAGAKPLRAFAFLEVEGEEETDEEVDLVALGTESRTRSAARVLVPSLCEPCSSPRDVWCGRRRHAAEIPGSWTKICTTTQQHGARIRLDRRAAFAGESSAGAARSGDCLVAGWRTLSRCGSQRERHGRVGLGCR